MLQVNLCRAIGGSAFHHTDLALGLVERGCAVLGADRLGGFTERRTAGAAGHQTMTRGAFHLELVRAIRRFRPDIIHAHQRLAARVANRVKGRIPVISTIHNEYDERSYGGADGIIRVADHQKAGMASYRGSSVTIGNWLRSTPGDDADPGSVRAEFGVARENFVFGTVSRLLAGKGIFDLLAAFRAVADPHARLLIVGTGPAMQKARRRAEGDRRIIFTGHRADAQRLMRAMDVFVMPSHQETYPLVLIEAAAAGCALIATATDGAREVLNGIPASIVAPQDVPALADSMQQALCTFSGKHPRVRYDLSPFDRDRQIGRVLAFYESILNREGDQHGL